MGILHLCGLANSEYLPPGLSRQCAKPIKLSKEEPMTTVTLPRAAPTQLHREPSFGSWDDAKIGAVRDFTGESL